MVYLPHNKGHCCVWKGKCFVNRYICCFLALGSYTLLIRCLITTSYLPARRTAIVPQAQEQAHEEKYGQGAEGLTGRMVQMLDMMAAANSTGSESTEAHCHSVSAILDLKYWFTTFLMLQSFNTVPHVLVTVQP